MASSPADPTATRDLDTIVDDLDGREFEIDQGDGSTQTIYVESAGRRQITLVDGDSRDLDPTRAARVADVTKAMIQPEGHLPRTGGATAFVESIGEWARVAQEEGML